jgi:hypothetical protein
MRRPQSIPAGRRQARASLLEVLEPRQLMSVVNITSGMSIQAAIVAAGPGGTVNCAAGTYAGGFTGTSADSGVTIKGAGAGTTTILSSTSGQLTSAGAIAEIQTTGVSLTGFTIEGPAAGLNGLAYGVLVDMGGTGVISSDTLTNIWETVPNRGDQIGIGVGVTFGSAQILTDNISNYQKNGIQIGSLTPVAGQSASATIMNTTVTGVGLDTANTQNGILFVYGAYGTVSGCTVSQNLAAPALDDAATGIYVLDAKTVTIQMTTSNNNDEDIVLSAGAHMYGGSANARLINDKTFGATYDGVDLFAGTGATGVTGAVISGLNSHNNALDGIYIDSVKDSGNTIENSTFASNSGYDIEDDGGGAENTYINNTYTSSYPSYPIP